jgi:hypothetical protein
MQKINVILLLAFWCCSVRADLPEPLACYNNIVALDGAKQQLQIDQNLSTGDPVTLDMLTHYFKSMPICPAGGIYTIGPIGQEPVCSIVRHSRPAVQSFVAHQSAFPWFVVIKRFVLTGVPVFGAYFIVRRLKRPLQRMPQ